jgi:ribonucleoside-diphosphate reductase alpha chain
MAKTAAVNRLAGLEKTGSVFTTNSVKVLEARYLQKDASGQLTETPEGLFRRVAHEIALVEETHPGGSAKRISEVEEEFYRLMVSGLFMPNSPTLMNAGRSMGMLSACFVLPVNDSIDEIFDSIKATALIQKAGGGTGFAFDALRPTGDYISSSGGTTSGPISFWRVFSEATNAIQQGAFRRGANMGMMYIDHPDILKFIFAKQDLSRFTNYNISVKVTDAFMKALKANPNAPHVVVNPRTREEFYLPKSLSIEKYQIRHLVPVRGAAAGEGATYWTVGELFDVIVDHAWQTGEPGVAFMDRINEANPTPHVGRIEATNPCGEQPLLPYEACNLGSINVGACVRAGKEGARFDWDLLRQSVRTSTRFLDNVIDANRYPLQQIEEICKNNRKIGLGIMGFADALFALGLPYNSDEGVAFGEQLMKFVNDESHQMSQELAGERGSFPNWKGSTWDTRHGRPMRNACSTTVAPTGTISIIANCSGGIEPLFSLAFFRNVLDGQRLVEVNERFQQVAQERGFHTDELMATIAREGTIQHLPGIPDDVKRVFVTARDVSPEWHIRMQAAFQRHCDSSISKTTNFPTEATRDDVRKIYLMAFESGCKGVTVYRDGARANQPMALDNQATPKDAKKNEPAPQPVDLTPMRLPSIMSCLRIRQTTPFGNMHVKISVEPSTGREREVFAQLGKGGDVANSDLEAICRLMSLFLRCGGTLTPALKQLEGIGSSLTIPSREGRITSLADGLARAIRRYLKAKEAFGLEALLLGKVDLASFEEKAIRKSGVYSENGGNGHRDQAFKIKCPECSGDLVFEEGCVRCHGCGFSQC